MVGSTSQRQVRMSVCQQIITENEDTKSMTEIKELVERKLMEYGYAWHTRRDYLRVLRLI